MKKVLNDVLVQSIRAAIRKECHEVSFGEIFLLRIINPSF